MFLIIVFRLGSNRPSGVHLFFPALFLSTHPSLVPLRLFPYLFHSCFPRAWVFRKTLVHEFLIFYSHTQWYFFFEKIHDQNGRRVACRKLTIIIKKIDPVTANEPICLWWLQFTLRKSSYCLHQ